jgi:hypothetical protein
MPRTMPDKWQKLIFKSKGKVTQLLLNLILSKLRLIY